MTSGMGSTCFGSKLSIFFFFDFLDWIEKLNP